MRWRDYGSLGFEGASTFVWDTNGDTVVNAVPFVVGKSVSSLDEDDNDWNLGKITLSSNADTHTSSSLDVLAIQTWCRELSHAVLNMNPDLFKLAL